MTIGQRSPSPWLARGASMLIAIAAATSATPARAAAQDEYRSHLDTTVALNPDGTVELSLVSGEIHVSSWARNEVRIQATSESGILQLDTSPSRLTLGVRSYRGELGDTRYEIVIPATARLLANTVSGDITTRGGSSVEARSVSGDIDVSDVTGRVSLSSVSGGITAARIGGGLSAGSVSSDLQISNISGEIELSDTHSSYVHTETVSGDTRFSGTIDPKGRYDFHSHSGDIRLAVPPVGASLEIETFSGDIDSDYPMTLLPGSHEGNRHVQFTINGGGARISASSFSGNITIERASQPR